MPLHNYGNAVVIEQCIIIQVNRFPHDFCVQESASGTLIIYAKWNGSHFIRCKFWHGQSVATDYLCHETSHWKVFIGNGSCRYRRECACGWELVCVVVFLVCWHVNVNMCIYIWAWCCNCAQYTLICTPIVHAVVTKCLWAGTDVKIFEKFTAQKDRATGGKEQRLSPNGLTVELSQSFSHEPSVPVEILCPQSHFTFSLIPCR